MNKFPWVQLGLAGIGAFSAGMLAGLMMPAGVPHLALRLVIVLASTAYYTMSLQIMFSGRPR